MSDLAAEIRGMSPEDRVQMVVEDPSVLDLLLAPAPSVDDLLTQLHERHGAYKIERGAVGDILVFIPSIDGSSVDRVGWKFIAGGASLREALEAALKETT